jgi:hypothetical protein
VLPCVSPLLLMETSNPPSPRLAVTVTLVAATVAVIVGFVPKSPAVVELSNEAIKKNFIINYH